MDKASADLIWFFGVGISAFEHSAFGSMLERASLYAVRAPRAEGETMLVRPQAASSRDEPERKLLVRYGDISRRLGTLSARDPRAVRALGLAFGDHGAGWAEHKLGRVVALFPLVPSGVALVTRAKASPGSEFTLSNGDRLRVEVELETVQPGRSPVRSGLVASAAVEAHELLAQALRAWRAVR